MATTGTPLSFSDVLRLRPVRRLWIAQIVSVFGDFLAVFAIIAVVTFQLHGTATQVAMVLVSFMAPLAIVSPLAGVFRQVEGTLAALPQAGDDRKRSDPRRTGAGTGVRARPVRDLRHPVHDERGLSLLRSGAIGGGAHAGPDGGTDGSGLGFADELQAKRFAIKLHRADHVGHAKRDHRDAKRGLNGLCHNDTRGKEGDAKYRGRHENNVLESARWFLPDLANFLRIADGGSPN